MEGLLLKQNRVLRVLHRMEDSKAVHNFTTAGVHYLRRRHSNMFANLLVEVKSIKMRQNNEDGA